MPPQLDIQINLLWDIDNSNIVEYHSRLTYKRRAYGPCANKIVKVPGRNRPK